jgi:ubiquinone/menaquinone biosynthesis C-methylase UbiE
MTPGNMQTHDYRDSHQNRGDVYDESLALDPFDAYMHAWEQKHIHDLLRRHIPESTSRCRYLDFACGTGRVTAIIAPLVRETVGVDVSESMLKVAKTKIPNARFLHIDLTSTPFESESFDLVSAFRFFGNADPGLREDALAALYRSLRPGGLLLTNNHRNPGSVMNLVQRVQRRPLHVDLKFSRFAQLLENAGFDTVATRAIGAWQFRQALSTRAGRRPRLEALLEAMFGGSYWAPLAPDYIVMARKPA